jgi:SAM-dependent methyltransferase
MQVRPFVVRNGRSYIADTTLHYPLPVDLAELHRQSLRTLLLCQLFGGPLCSPVFANKPPMRVLEVGCGSAFWSMMCHRFYARHGHTTISFTGVDIAPIAPGASGQGTTTTGGSGGVGRGSGGNRASASSSASSGLDGRPDKDMRWRFVQHDIRTLPWPFADGEFDLVMVKDMSLATPLAMQQTLMDEYLRVLRPGGVIEVWESDYTLRMLRPHFPQSQGAPSQATKKPHDGLEAEDEESEASGSDESDEDDHQKAANHGAYLMTANTPLSGPLNNFLVEYNGWISKALEARSLSAVPCTLIGALLRQEVDTLTAMQSKRLAVPLSEVRWEREGVGGVVTKDGKSYIETKGRRGGVGAEGGDGRPLGASQAAVRKTALLTVIMQIQSLEGILKEASGKSQDEWDGWCGKMMNDLMKENGTSWGESLEIGAWWATKKA